VKLLSYKKRKRKKCHSLNSENSENNEIDKKRAIESGCWVKEGAQRYIYVIAPAFGM
jgi:hypothetical protein